jgi:hypothetical protein
LPPPFDLLTPPMDERHYCTSRQVIGLIELQRCPPFFGLRARVVLQFLGVTLAPTDVNWRWTPIAIDRALPRDGGCIPYRASAQQEDLTLNPAAVYV